MQDYNGRTAIICASDNGRSDVVRALLNDERVNVNIVDNNGRTALMCALDNGHLGVVGYLLDHQRVVENI